MYLESTATNEYLKLVLFCCDFQDDFGKVQSRKIRWEEQL